MKKWFEPRKCSTCMGDGYTMDAYDGPNVCRSCSGAGKPLAYQEIPNGALVALVRACEPSRLSNPHSAIEDTTFEWGKFKGKGFAVKIALDSHAFVIGNRLDQIDKRDHVIGSWQGHDVLCMHDRCGICWLPSSHMRIIAS